VPKRGKTEKRGGTQNYSPKGERDRIENDYLKPREEEEIYLVSETVCPEVKICWYPMKGGVSAADEYEAKVKTGKHLP